MPNKVIGFDTTKAHTTDIVKSILTPLNGELHSISNYLKDGLPEADLYVISGILRGCGLAFKQCLTEHKDFLFVDHAYFNKGYDAPTWMRITKNRHAFGPKLVNNDPTRFNKFFSHYKLNKWRGGEGDYILLMPPTHAIGWLFDDLDWEERTIAKLKQFTDRPIRIRPKPSNPVVDDFGNLIRMEKSKGDAPLAQDLANAYAVVIYNSNAAVDCTIAGVPILCENACCGGSIAFNFNDLETTQIKYEPLRSDFLYNLANAQFSKEEMKKGHFLDYLDISSSAY